MRIIDLFSGIGGMSLGFHAANYPAYDFTLYPWQQQGAGDGYYKTVAFVEVNAYCQQLLREHFPRVPIFPDVVEFHPEGKADIVTGGFPCQDLSPQGKRQGIHGARSGLFEEMLRIANECSGRYILFENSSELVRNRRYFSVFSDRLRYYGYGYAAFLLSAAQFGYPHWRERAYVIAYATGERRQSHRAILAKMSVLSQLHEREIQQIECVAPDELRRTRRFRDIAENLPDIRKYNGLSKAVDRVTSLGNSLIPIIPFMFAKTIKEIEHETSQE